MELPKVAVVGRPNVGKSTLFNRFVGKRVAIVEEIPKVTRDRKEVDVSWAGRAFTLVDTGGWLKGGSTLDEKVSKQSEEAIKSAAVVLFVVDASVGVTEEDLKVRDMLHRANVSEVLVVANKVDSDRQGSQMWEFASLGFGEPLAVSALHGRLSGDLLDEIVRRVDAPYEIDDVVDEGIPDEGDAKIIGVALVGRPNVGKSTLFNRLVGEERSVVHDMAGTTTDTVDTFVEKDGLSYRFVDTAGLRRKSKSSDGTEYFSMVRTLQAIDSSDIALLVIDARDGVTAQDQRLAERIDLSGSPAIVLLNKWDLLSEDEKLSLDGDVKSKLGFLSYMEPLRVSALSGHNLHRIWRFIEEANAAYTKRVPTRELNKLIVSLQVNHPPKKTKILYGVQGATDPPTFTLFATKEIETSYLRYVENRIREHFGLGVTPIKIRVRHRSG